MQQSQLVENFRQVHMFTQILLFFRVSPLLFFSSILVPFPQKSSLKTSSQCNECSVSTQCKQVEQKRSMSSFQFFFTSLKKRKMSELLYNSSQFQNKDEKTHKDQSTPPYPQNDVPQIQRAFCSLSKPMGKVQKFKISIHESNIKKETCFHKPYSKLSLLLR